MLETQVRVHLLEARVLVLQLLQTCHVGGLHATVLRFPVVVSRLGNAVFSARVLDLSTALDLLQDSDDLALSETGFAHRILLIA